MSKEAAQRAVRDARNAERLAKGSTGIPARRFGQPAAPARPSAPRGTRPPVAPPVQPAAATETAAEAPDAAAEPAAEAEELCGHKSMNGRTCTRERGHSAKNHRYS